MSWPDGTTFRDAVDNVLHCCWIDARLLRPPNRRQNGSSLTTFLKSTCAFLAVLSSIALLVSPASAEPPETERTELVFDFTDVDACGPGADLIISFERATSNVTFSEDGVTTRQIRAFNNDITYTRVDTGNTEVLRNRVTRIDEYDNGEVVSSRFIGPTLVLTAPQQGVIALVAGVLEFDADGDSLFEAGPDRLPATLAGALCEALA